MRTLHAVTGSLLRGLVCDDAPASRHAVEAILTRSGFEVVGSFGSVPETLLAAELSAPDVIVLDLALAGDLGLRVIAALQAARPGCAVVVLSPFASLRGSTLEAGAYDFVPDPGLDLRELERCIRRLAGERRSTTDEDGHEAPVTAAHAEDAATSPS